MNKDYIATKFEQSRLTYNQQAQAQQQAINQLMAFLKEANLPSSLDVLEFGAGTGLLTRQLLSELDVKSIHINDLSNPFSSFWETYLKNNKLSNYQFLIGDIEQLPLPSYYDLIVSSSTEQWIQGKDLFYKKIASHLHSGAYFAFTSFGSKNLCNLYKATGVSLQYTDVEETTHLLSKYFKVQLAQEEEIQIHFDSPLAILRHLKETGVNGLLKHQWTISEVNQLLDRIKTHCQSDKGYSLTYHPTYYIAICK